jgi:ribosomal protein S27AE
MKWPWKKRDYGYSCPKCGAYWFPRVGKNDVHHLRPGKDGLDWLSAVCPRCDYTTSVAPLDRRVD